MPANPALTDPAPSGVVDSDGDGLIEIHTLTMLHNMRYSLNGSEYKTAADAQGLTSGCPVAGCNGYELAADLDFDANGSGSTWAYTHNSETGALVYTIDSGDHNETYFNAQDGGWLPIDNFSAIFKGNGFRIRNLALSRERDNVGLFGSINGFIDNVHIEQALVIGDRNVGALVGSISGGGIHSSSTSGMVIGENSVGGLVGQAWDTDIVLSSSRADVRGDNVYAYALGIGGLVGAARGTIRIAQSYTTATVSGNGAAWLGGLVGLANASIAITASYSTATVGSNGSWNGGLVGHSEGDVCITASYATGNVRAQGTAGGLIGLSMGNTSITASYARGTVTSKNGSAGGLVGGASPLVIFTAAVEGAQREPPPNYFIRITASYASGNVLGGTMLGGLIGLAESSEGVFSVYITASYASGDIIGDLSGTERIGDLIGDGIDYAGTRDSRIEIAITESYGFGKIIATGDINASIRGAPPHGLRSPSGLSARNAGPSWNSAASGTAGAWDFGAELAGNRTAGNLEGPALRFADYDGAESGGAHYAGGAGSTYYCEGHYHNGQSAGAGAFVEIPNCGEHLGGQF